MRFEAGDIVRVVDVWDPEIVKKPSNRDKYLGTTITISKVYPDREYYLFEEDEYDNHDGNPGARYIIRESEIVGFAEECNIDQDEFSKILNGDNCEVI